MKERSNIAITEQDIFNFVFYPDTLSEEKRSTIKENKSFSEAIEFYQNLKSEIDSKLDYSIKKKIAQKIPAYSLPKMIELHPLKDVDLQKKPHRLAADSEKELKPRITAKTFVDDEKDYMVKILQNGEKTKVFVFSTQDEILENFNIYLEPQQLEFHFKDNSEPLILQGKVEIDKIRIHFD
jgi:vacuolar-type H+-ATPase subunit I/STV1